MHTDKFRVAGFGPNYDKIFPPAACKKKEGFMKKQERIMKKGKKIVLLIPAGAVYG